MTSYYAYHFSLLFITFLERQSFMLCLKAFKETDIFKDLSSLFHNEGPIYDKALKDEAILTLIVTTCRNSVKTLHVKRLHSYYLEYYFFHKFMYGKSIY